MQINGQPISTAAGVPVRAVQPVLLKAVAW